jgi:hypothetical protein
LAIFPAHLLYKFLYSLAPDSLIREGKAAENGLPSPSVKELVKRKPETGPKVKHTEDEIVNLLENCTPNKKSNGRSFGT